MNGVEGFVDKLKKSNQEIEQLTNKTTLDTQVLKDELITLNKIITNNYEELSVKHDPEVTDMQSSIKEINNELIKLKSNLDLSNNSIVNNDKNKNELIKLLETKVKSLDDQINIVDVK